MQTYIRIPFLFLYLVTLAACGNNTNPDTTQEDPRDMSWDAVLAEAEGKTVDLMMWMGDPQINGYINDFVKSALKEQYEIDLNVINGQGNTIVQTLMAEKQARRPESEIDLMWINGETFYQLRQIESLWGPWTAALPNARNIDFDNPFIGTDFQQPVEGYECPWGNVQMALIYDSARVSNPPQNRAELRSYVEGNPGTFTFDNQFTGLTFLKTLLIDIAGGSGSLSGPFDEEKYNTYAPRLWDYLREMKPHLWKSGTNYPEGVAPMHQMFANGELHFTMSNNDAEVDNKIRQGVFPETARAYVWDIGTIQNSHYMGITKRSGDKAAAMVVVNFLISPEAQYQKMQPKVWGDGTILSRKKLPEEWQTKFADIPGRTYAPDRAEIQDRALMELAPEYMIRLADDFRTELLNL
jgi:putative spermidine/putrescine transport system substrate-binding protein